MALPPYQISRKSTKRFESYQWDTHTQRQTDRQTDTHTYIHTHTHTQTGDLISLFSFLESRLKSLLFKSRRSHLGGVMVSVLTIEPIVHGLKPG
jgi:hypothetical protein